jgi:hypothetical protein
LECLRLLLRHADEDDAVADTALLPEPVGHVVFPLFVIELVNRNLFALRQRLHRFAELLRDLPQYHRRRNRFTQLLPHEGYQPT